MNVEGFVARSSEYDVRETIDRFAEAVVRRGMRVMARIDHAAAAAQVGMKLRPTELLIFGDAKVGTLLLQQAQMIGIDLPLKALAWQDEDGKNWLAYDDPRWLAQRHGWRSDMEPTISAMLAALDDVAVEVTKAKGGDSTFTP